MCGDCWNAAMGAPAAVVAARFAWVGYKDRIPFLGRDRGGPAPEHEPEPVEEPVATDEAELVESGAPPP